MDPQYTHDGCCNLAAAMVAAAMRDMLGEDAQARVAAKIFLFETYRGQLFLAALDVDPDYLRRLLQAGRIARPPYVRSPNTPSKEKTP